MGLTLIVCGGRNFRDREYVFKVLDFVREKRDISLIIHGGATGADSLADEWAIARGMERMAFKANWELYGKAAGPKRNSVLADIGDGVIAFPGGSGTADMIRQARAKNIPILMACSLFPGPTCAVNGDHANRNRS